VKVILVSDVPNLGRAGDVKEVADGYARNYLIPRGLAKKATPGILRDLENRQAAEAAQKERLTARLQALARRLSQVTLVFDARVSEQGRLFGAITTADIAEALEREVGTKFDRRKHILTEPLRHIGEHYVPIRLSPKVTVNVRVVIRPEGEETTETPAEHQT